MMRCRFHCTTTGRFLYRDPVNSASRVAKSAGRAGGRALGQWDGTEFAGAVARCNDLKNPNLYTYCDNDPVNKVDAMGMDQRGNGTAILNAETQKQTVQIAAQVAREQGNSALARALSGAPNPITSSGTFTSTGGSAWGLFGETIAAVTATVFGYNMATAPGRINQTRCQKAPLLEPTPQPWPQPSPWPAPRSTREGVSTDTDLDRVKRDPCIAVLDSVRYPNVAQHILWGQRRGIGLPFTLTIDHNEAEQEKRRYAATKNSNYEPKQPDEWPMAMFFEGGAGASI